MTLKSTEEPRSETVADYPSAPDRPEIAAAELARLKGVGKNSLYLDGVRPDDLRDSHPLHVAEPDVTRMVYDWLNPA